MKSVSSLLWGGEGISLHKSPDQCGPEKQHLTTGLEDSRSLSISSSAKGQSDRLTDTNQLALSLELNIKADITFLKEKKLPITIKIHFSYRLDIINFWLREHYK